MKIKILVVLAVGLLVFGATERSTFATSFVVSPLGYGTVGVLTDLGFYSAGTYEILGSGEVGLTETDFLLYPNGVPVTAVTVPGYSYFNPNGTDIADGLYGQAGAGVNLGALIGTFSATPSVPADWFLIGYDTTVTVGSGGGHIYASVNDTYHGNNVGYFTAEVISLGTVPEPTTMLLFGSGLAGLAGLAGMRRRKE